MAPCFPAVATTMRTSSAGRLSCLTVTPLIEKVGVRGTTTFDIRGQFQVTDYVTFFVSPAAQEPQDSNSRRGEKRVPIFAAPHFCHGALGSTPSAGFGRYAGSPLRQVAW